MTIWLVATCVLLNPAWLVTSSSWYTLMSCNQAAIFDASSRVKMHRHVKRQLFATTLTNFFKPVWWVWVVFLENKTADFCVQDRSQQSISLSKHPITQLTILLGAVTLCRHMITLSCSNQFSLKSCTSYVSSRCGISLQQRIFCYILYISQKVPTMQTGPHDAEDHTHSLV